jgi:glycosyltransferase involved in cell wall biosynthesis
MTTKQPTKSNLQTKRENTDALRIGIVVPHIFMHGDVLPHVIFSPGQLALDLVAGLQQLGAEVTMYTPGPVETPGRNVTADLSYFEQELAERGDSYTDLLRKHPMTFVTLARQLQSELIAQAYADANSGEIDIVHIYTNEEDIALPFAQFCSRPVVFTHHDPYNFLVKYKNVFPKYAHLNWISMSHAQRRGMPADTNWVANIHHGIDIGRFELNEQPKENFVAFMGRIIEPKGVHLAIAAVRAYNSRYKEPLQLRIAGKHYAGHSKDSYWREVIEPQIDNKTVFYDGYIKTDADKQQFLGNARALLMPSTFEEPFGMVMLEAMACGTPVVGLNSGAIPEVISETTGVVVEMSDFDDDSATALAEAIHVANKLERRNARITLERKFDIGLMVAQHLELYQRLIK